MKVRIKGLVTEVADRWAGRGLTTRVSAPKGASSDCGAKPNETASTTPQLVDRKTPAIPQLDHVVMRCSALFATRTEYVEGLRVGALRHALDIDAGRIHEACRTYSFPETNLHGCSRSKQRCAAHMREQFQCTCGQTDQARAGERTVRPPVLPPHAVSAAQTCLFRPAN